MSTSQATVMPDLLAIRYRIPLISYFRRRGIDPVQSEDLAHEVFARLSRRDVGAQPNPDAYVFSSAWSVYADHVRRLKSHASDRHVCVDGLEFESEAAAPDRVLQGKQSLRRLAAILEELPQKTREILLLSRLEGLSNTDLAGRFGLSTSSIEKHLARGLLHVRTRFAADD